MQHYFASTICVEVSIDALRINICCRERVLVIPSDKEGAVRCVQVGQRGQLVSDVFRRAVGQVPDQHLRVSIERVELCDQLRDLRPVPHNATSELWSLGAFLFGL